MNDIIEKQKQFQKLVGFPIDSLQEKDRNELSEIYLFKMIEEIIELRKEIPSVMNPWSKTNGNAEKTKVLDELSDVILFLLNFCITWRLSKDEILEALHKVQNNNFIKVKEKKMNLLNQELLSLPGYDIVIGVGNLSPKQVIIDGDQSMILENTENYYTMTNKNKSKNSVTNSEFWKEYLNREIEILMIDNPTMQIIQ